ncbi:MAG: 2-oxo acid dehydrogenase subunit E2, partial [Parachlamydiaceae bacterium]|nr:2-oxo acid dehydrogenase subunit E2 [Parachlamydiaceae bacterium]
MDNQIFTVRLPDIGEGVVEGEVIEWLKQVGDPIKQDEPVVVVMTDKATVELPSPYPGVLFKQYFRVGEISIKDKPLYDIKLDMALPVSERAQEKVKADIEPAMGLSTPQQDSQICSFSPENRENKQVLATPKVRGLAKDIGVDLQGLIGTGKEGRISKADLKQHGDPTAPLAIPAGQYKTALLHLQDDEEMPLLGIRGLMAKKMAEGHAQIPQFSYFEQVEATRLIQLRANTKEKAGREGINLSYMPFFIRALSLTIMQFPLMNSCVDVPSAKIFIHQQHNIGIAMASPQGLIVPVLKSVQVMSLEEIIKAYEALKKKSNEGKLSPSDMKEATITITNFGVLEGAG